MYILDTDRGRAQMRGRNLSYIKRTAGLKAQKRRGHDVPRRKKVDMIIMHC